MVGDFLANIYRRSFAQEAFDDMAVNCKSSSHRSEEERMMNLRSQIRLRRAETANRKKMRIDGPRTMMTVIEKAIILRWRIFLA